jgi:ribosomal protein L37E
MQTLYLRTTVPRSLIVKPECLGRRSPRPSEPACFAIVNRVGAKEHMPILRCKRCGVRAFALRRRTMPTHCPNCGRAFDAESDNGWAQKVRVGINAPRPAQARRTSADENR